MLTFATMFYMSNPIFNFIIRFLFFWVISALVMQKFLLEAVFFSLIMAGGFTLFDFLFGSSSLKKQNKNIVRIVAGQGLHTTRDTFAWIFINIVLLAGSFLALTGILYLIAGEVFWVWIAGAVGSIFLYIWVTQSAKRHIKKRSHKD